MSEQDAKKPSSNGNTRNESLLEHVIQNVETIHHLCLETFDYYEQKRLEVPSTNAST